MLRIRWVDNTIFLRELFGVFDGSYCGVQGCYHQEWNEIILVRNMTQSKRELARVLFHEFLHYLIYRLKLPGRLDRVIDRLDWKLQKGAD